MPTRKLAALFLTLGLLPAAHAQFIQQGSKLVGIDAGIGAVLGTSVSVSSDGNTAVVGGPGDNNGAGAVRVYVRINGVWSQQGPKLAGTGATATARQGESVAISADGNTVIVGGPLDNNSAGAVWVYVRSNGVWSQQTPKLIGAGAVGIAAQGSSLAVSGDGNTVIVGGPADNDSEGAAWVFTRTNGAWSQQGSKLVGAGALRNAGQGKSVAVSADGDTVIVGGSSDNPNLTGAAWVFTRTNGVWSQQGTKLVGADATASAAQGSSVALSTNGNTAIVGGPNDNGAVGAAWIYTRSGEVWSQQGPKLVGTGAVGIASQGVSVAISGDGNTAIAGGTGDNQSVGAAWVFTRTNGVWGQQSSKLIGTGGSGPSKQGRSVALSGDGHTAIVGGLDDQPLGAAWVYVSAPVHLIISAPASVTAGDPFSFTVTALNASNSVVTNYTGTVHFSTNDPIGELPGDSQLINGVGTFQATLKTGVGSFLNPTIMAVDTANQLISGISNPIAVQSAAASRYAFSAVPPSAISGVPFSFIISAFDRFGNFLLFNASRVRFSSSDGAAILPAESITSSVTTFSAILKTVGNQTITVTDAGNSSITGTSNTIMVVSPSSNSNLAVGKAATQSGIFQGNASYAAGNAVDGSTDGNFGNGSVTHTSFDVNAWWQVDLGASAAVNSLVIWNRTDCCATRLSDYWVFVSDTPFGPADTPTTLQNRPGTFSIHQTTVPNPATTITAGVPGRYVRVQLTGTGFLSLAEVQVLGTPGSSAGMSLTSGRPATQSSTLPGYPTAGAAGAADSNTGGNFFNGSVTHTDLDPNPWWQVDLGASAKVNSVAIWNRTDCCSNRLSDYWVFVSDTPFSPSDTPATLQIRSGTFSSHQIAAPNPSAVISFGSTSGVSGRYVRVQLTGAGYLSLAEVQVFGTPGTSSSTNVSLGKAASQSSALSGTAGAAVDGNTDGNFFNGSVTHTNMDTNAWWQVDLGTSAAIGSVVIWNRTDCCGTRLNDYWVFVSDTPFSATDTPATLQNRAGTFASHQTTAPSPSAMIAIGAQGRYVRVQLTGANFLGLAEVQVFGQ